MGGETELEGAAVHTCPSLSSASLSVFLALPFPRRSVPSICAQQSRNPESPGGVPRAAGGILALGCQGVQQATKMPPQKSFLTHTSPVN